MRRFLALLVLCACQMTAPVDTTAPEVTPQGTEDIEVTKLGPAPVTPTAPDAAAAAPAAPTTPAPPADPALAGPDTPHPKPRPDAETPVETAAPIATPAEDAAPPVPVSPQQALCEKSGGQWATAQDTGANLCVKRTRDSGKRCDSKNDCQGQCLARSQTCSPIDPMIGCNDVLEKDGRMVTLCLN